jgi:DNA-binding IclR family transcriptional regulator
VASSELTSLQKGLQILKELAASEHPLTPSEISQATGLNRSTTYRLLEVLEEKGWVAQMPGHGGARGAPYDLGFAAHGLAVLVTSKYDLTAKLEPVVSNLARLLDETVHVGMLEHDKVVHVSRALPDEGPNMAVRVGEREFAHATALGKAILATLPIETFRDLYPEEQLMTRGPQTVQTRTQLLEELGRVAALGYALDAEGSRPGVRCLAVPIFSPDGTAGLAISITTMAIRLDDSRVPEVAAAVGATAALATAAFGGHAPARWGVGTTPSPA